jgi:hypothetical protein
VLGIIIPMRGLFILAAAAVLALLSTCAVDKHNTTGTAQPIEIEMSFTTVADFNPDYYYFPDVSGPNRGQRWERYIVFHGSDLIVDNCGTLSKSDIGQYTPVGKGPSDIITAKLSGADDLDDLATANTLEDSVSILIQLNDQNFASGVDYKVGDAPTSLLSYDYNGDGKLDLIVANSADTAEGKSLSLLPNDGEGVFGAQTKIALPQAPYGICSGDFNGDGKEDLAVTYYSDSAEGNKVAVLLKNDTGFDAPITTDVGKLPTAIAVTDLNHDANDDLAVLNSFDGAGGNSLMLLQSDGDGTFTIVQTLPTDRQPAGLAVGKLNADDQDDYVVACAYNGDLGNTLNIFRSNGSGGYEAPELLAVGHSPSDVLIQDINGDSLNDLIVVESADDADGNQVRTLMQAATGGGFGNAKTIKVGKSPRAATLFKFSGDDFWDCAVANSADAAQGNSVSLLDGSATGEFTGVVIYWTDELPQPLKNQYWYRSVSVTRNTFTVRVDPLLFKDLNGQVPTSFLVDFMTASTGIDYVSNPDDYGIVFDWLLRPVVVQEQIGFETDESKLQLEQAPDNPVNPPPESADIIDWHVVVK